MGNFKESNYYKSEEHLKNTEKARILGIKKIKELAKKRESDYYLNPSLCKQCNNILSYKKRRNKFCGSSCAGKYNNKNRDTSFINENFRLKHREISIESNRKKYGDKYIPDYSYDTQKFCICGKELTYNQKVSKNIYCSNSCRANNVPPEVNDKIRKKLLERVKNGTHKGWSTRKIISYPEQFFIDVFNSRNILYKYNFPINKRKDLGLDNSANYFLDFYFEDKKIDLEIDGSQHENRKEHDVTRDKNLSKIGIHVYRIKWKNINSKKGKSYITKEINNFLFFLKNYKINLGVSP